MENRKNVCKEISIWFQQKPFIVYTIKLGQRFVIYVHAKENLKRNFLVFFFCSKNVLKKHNYNALFQVELSDKCIVVVVVE